MSALCCAVLCRAVFLSAPCSTECELAAGEVLQLFTSFSSISVLAEDAIGFAQLILASLLMKHA